MLGAVNNNNNPYVNPYTDKADDKAKTGQNQPVNAANKADDISKEEQSKPRVLNSDGDEYIHSDGDTEKSSGAYRFENDKNGKRKIVFDRPDSKKTDAPTDSAPEKTQAGKSPEDASKPNADAMPPEKPEKENGPEKPGGKESGTGTADTDKVDAEIKKLKTEKQQAQQALNSANGDDEKRKAAEQRLAQIEAELSAKDNDGYRKANTSFTESSAPM